ncbi:fibronectin type III domain-containing protein [Nocardioides marmotae]|uniref:fibronectin type III domain-containing protein n=1 Tax=Nocardioides marmotae TaxID=2663857 RepID=UPI0012B573B9|nr:fibronectin type III domain-containing protein [Nocardioides marmotae]MBC9733758.1 fibronectin type III domain-containing protein [Nocardioides marmotae]MTB84861.1 hypothetical protein [Nocardioides marmotae]
MGGAISGDEVWTKDEGPYRVTSTVTIPSGASLTVEPGTTIELVQPNLDYGTVFRVGGVLDIDGDTSDPVRLLAPGQNGSNTLAEPTNGTTTGVVQIDALQALSDRALDVNASPAPGTALASLSISDSRLRVRQVTLDNRVTGLSLQRNVLAPSASGGTVQLDILNPSLDRAVISDNRLRSTQLSCSGSGRLTASGNTFERGLFPYSYDTTRVQSNDDCVLDVTNSFWEADDTELGNRIGGVGRVLYTPSASAPSPATPAFTPSTHRQYQSFDQFNRAYLDVTPTSDGGLPTKIVAFATNRETMQVEQTLEVDARRWPRQMTERLVFDELTPTSLYTLSGYLENDLGRSATLSSESFVVREPVGTPPPLDGKTLGGTLTADTTLTAAGGPYTFSSTLEVPAGVTLTVEPGTEFVVREIACCSSLPVLIRAAGTVVMGAVDGAPVVIDTSAATWSTPALFGAPEGADTARFSIHGLHAVQSQQLWTGSSSPARFEMTDSHVTGWATFDNAQSELIFERNVVDGSSLRITNPRESYVTVTRNRFRSATLQCDGRGSLVAAGNTFERGVQAYNGSRVSSEGDCRLDVSGNYWESTDNEVGQRINGAARVVWRPTASSSQAGTPVIAPAQHSQSYSTDAFGRTFLDVQTGSDGGEAAGITAYATERVNGTIVEQHEVPASARTSATYERFTFTTLEPGKLYALHSVVENGHGKTDVLQTESFLAPLPNGGVPPVDGKSLGGVLTKDTTLTAGGGPYEFTRTLTVPVGITLTVEPGTQLLLGEVQCCQASEPLIQVGGAVTMGSSTGPAVVVDMTPRNYWSNRSLFGPIAETTTARIDLENVRIAGIDRWTPLDLWDSGYYGTKANGSFERLTIRGSELTATRLAVARTDGTVILARNSLDATTVDFVATDAAPRQITDNRFRQSTLSCSGTGRLEARGNTFEAYGGRVVSNDSCVLDVSGNHWEVPDEQVANRVEGRLRTIYRPTIPAPTAETPTMAPGGFGVGIEVDENNGVTAYGFLGSTGGAATEVTLRVIDVATGGTAVEKKFDDVAPDESMEVAVAGLEVGTLYRVTGTATNAEGSVEAQGAESFLFPAPAPTSPTNVKATTSGRDITVSWAPPTSDGGNPVRTYSIYNEYTGDLQTVDGSARSVTFTGLDWSTRYDFTVVATSDVGTSRPATVHATTAAAPNTGTTPPPTGGGTTPPPSGGGGGGGGAPAPTGKAPLAPTSVSAKAGDKAAIVTWSAAEANGSPVTGYTVSVSPGGRTVEVAGTTTSATVTGLTNGTPYTFTVTATNAVGTSGASVPSAPVTPAGKPEAPAEVTVERGDGELTVVWSPPAIGTPATSYVVSLNPGGASRDLGVADRTVTFDGLDNGTTYTATVVARNEHGDGPGASAAGTPAGAPGAPVGTSAEGRAGSVRLTWAMPTANGTAITGYTVRVSPGGRTIDVAAGRTSLLVDGLRNGQRYLFEVTAENAVGAGKTVQVTAMPKAAPERVAAPKVVVKKNGKTVVSWTAPRTNGSPLIRYVVRSNHGDVVRVEGGRTRAVFANLVSGRGYRFRVVAVNAVGAGPRGENSETVRP